MNKKRDTYDRITVGERIRQKRIQLGLSQDELAVRINRATKYCSDIERGMCGMSIETMLSIAKALRSNSPPPITGYKYLPDLPKLNDTQHFHRFLQSLSFLAKENKAFQ